MEKTNKAVVIESADAGWVKFGVVMPQGNTRWFATRERAEEAAAAHNFVQHGDIGNWNRIQLRRICTDPNARAKARIV